LVFLGNSGLCHAIMSGGRQGTKLPRFVGPIPLFALSGPQSGSLAELRCKAATHATLQSNAMQSNAAIGTRPSQFHHHFAGCRPPLSMRYDGAIHRDPAAAVTRVAVGFE